MRLRYFEIHDQRPLQDLAVTFQRPPDVLLKKQKSTIHFVVGVNGVGKSRFLVNLAHVFLSLERQARPSFPAVLAYDLGDGEQYRTIYFYSPHKDAGDPIIVEFDPPLPEDTRWTDFAQIDWRNTDSRPTGARNVYIGLQELGSGTVSSILPFLLTYTSGTPRYWQKTFAPRLRELECVRKLGKRVALTWKNSPCILENPIQATFPMPNGS